ncbi:hypothetical protein [Treponema zioleckii]|uniref:hypothetical protein n=1 Tax=Treponema zioleckii TaxID=331680 RepID=UPI00168BC93A|nr:hypothetical protein [Treponema zioleckii]
MLKKIFFGLLASVLFASTFTSCNSQTKPVVIWTDRAEVVSYLELFNLTNEKTKAVIAYKESLADAFPPTKDEAIPDIIIGSWLKNSRLEKNFKKIQLAARKKRHKSRNFLSRTSRIRKKRAFTISSASQFQSSGFAFFCKIRSND